MFGIDFAHPSRFWLVVALLPMATWSIRGSRRRLRDWGAFGQSGRPPGDGSFGRFLAMAFLVVALAQPRWGRSAGAEPPAGHDVVLCVDVSRSMAAEDAVPDRLGVAIASGQELLSALGKEPGPRAALVVFAGRAVVRCPLTTNLEAVSDALQSLKPGEVQPGGTDLADALEVSASAFDEEEHAEGRTIVVLSDGEDHPGAWPSAIERLETSGIIVHGVLIGDPDHAHPVPGPDRGPPAETRRTDIALGAVARSTGGSLVPIGLATADLGALYLQRIAPMARRRRLETRPPERAERFPVLILAAIGVGLAGPWPGPSRRLRHRLALSVPILASLTIGAGPGSTSPGDWVAIGRAAYDAGRFLEALDAFEKAIAIDGASAVARYDSAAALFQLRRYPEAIARYEEARDRGDLGLSTKIDYALGNAYLTLGQIPEALARYDACIASTRPGADLDAVRRDATENRRFASSQPTPPPESSGGGTPRANRPDRPRNPKAGDLGSTGDNPPSSSTTGANSSEAGRDGGASPSSSTAPGAGQADRGRDPRGADGSPEARLDAALREIREARDRRPTEDTRTSSNGRWKDW